MARITTEDRGEDCGDDPRLPVVYTAGPFTAATQWDIECNVMAMRKIALEVARCGAVPLCPHANTSLFHGQLTPEFWYQATMELLRRCDAIVLHPLWRASSGSRRERDYAVQQCLPIFAWDTAQGPDKSGLAAWVKTWVWQRRERFSYSWDSRVRVRR